MAALCIAQAVTQADAANRRSLEAWLMVRRTISALLVNPFNKARYNLGLSQNDLGLLRNVSA